VLIGDDTGFEKKGSCWAGVQRQYTGTAGKITNCQLGVLLAYAGPRGRALIDRELCLPRSWTGDEGRLAAAKVPEGTPLRTKPQLLRLMIERAVAAGIPFRWVRADEACGGNGPLRAFLEEQEVSYVLTVSRDRVITTPAGRRRADALAVALPKGAWQRVSCGDGAKRRQVRLYPACHRYVTLAMLALAWLAVTRASLAGDGNDLMTSANEIRRMFTALCGPPRDEQHARHWSRWRRTRPPAIATTSDNEYKITKRGRECRLAVASGPREDSGMHAIRKGRAS
jgi:hypothetical protein